MINTSKAVNQITMQTKKTLTKLKLINWHYFNNETISLKKINLFSGENGAGKSTVLDAIQLILTTNSRKFNLAANTDSKRTLKSYVRGKTGEEGSEYLRNGAVISYIALEVYEEAKQRYFVLGAKFDSTDLESDVARKWFCEEGTLDDLSFITDNKPSKDEQFKNKGRKVSFIRQTTQAKDKFKHRMGHLQDNFFELLSRSMAFKPMKDVKSFVSQFILPENNVDINALRENIRNLKEMQLIVEKVRKQVDDLGNIKENYDEILRVEEQILVIDILLKIAEVAANNDAINEKTNSVRLEKQNKAQSEEEYSKIKNDINSISERYTNTLAAINTGETAFLISTIKGEIKEKEKDRERLSDDVKKLKQQLARIQVAWKYTPQYSDAGAREFALLENSEGEIRKRNIIVSGIENTFEKAQEDINNKLLDTVSKLNTLTKDIEKLSREIKDLEKNKITYDRNVIALKEAVEREFEARGISSSVRILADLLEISDSNWQNAVEGYLNTQRFHIIVEPQYYDIAAEVYDRNRSRIHTAAVVNTSKLDTESTADDSSLASVVISENIYARAYVNYLLGRVTMCENVSQLKEHKIAVTQGCMLYQGNALRKINPEIYRMPYIGKYALAQQLKIKREEYEKKVENKREFDAKKGNIDRTIKAIKDCNFEILKEVISSPIKYKEISAEILDLKDKLKEAENDPTYLKLQIEAEQIKKDLESKEKDKDEVYGKITRCGYCIERLEDEIENLQNKKLLINAQIEELSSGNESALAEASKKFDEHKKIKSADTIFDNYQKRRKVLDNKRSDKIIDLNTLQSNYNNGVHGTGIDMMPAYIEEYDELIKHDLISYEEKLRRIRENCETEFRESFLAKMRENIENATRLFKDLNKTLKPIYYGNDSYRFDWGPDKKKRKLHEMIMSDFNLGGFNLFSTQFDEEYHDEMDELFSKLTASDEHGDDVIREYTDYRSYLDYDIDIVSKDGRTQKFSKIYREKSGGETQTPYYVAIAASFVQLYSIGETIRIIMLDEAFDKMDEERIVSMLDFFKEQNLQVILAAPTSRLELIGEQADNIIMIYTDGDHNSIAEEFSYDEI